MKKLLCSCGLVTLFILTFPIIAFTQVDTGSFNVVSSSFPTKRLFDCDDILEITLSGNVPGLMNDKDKKSSYRPMMLHYTGEQGKEIKIPIEIKTRGHFRKLLGNCHYPPLMLHFLKSETLSGSVFYNQNKLKLVMPCVDDSYVVREWLVYKLYNLITPLSFRAKLVRVKLTNTKKMKTTAPFYGILLESEKQLVKRNGTVLITRKTQPEQTDYEAFLKMAVFEYMIANTDWCIQYFQNIRLLAKDSSAVPVPVPYDFDHSGLVNAPYAKPAEALLMSSVRERRYRGYCLKDITQFEPVIEFYNGLKKDIYKLYSNCKLLDEKTIRSTLTYLDEFYTTINNTKKWKKDFSYPCDKNGTGNIVIKGLKED